MFKLHQLILNKHTWDRPQMPTQTLRRDQSLLSCCFQNPELGETGELLVSCEQQSMVLCRLLASPYCGERFPSRWEGI